VRFAEAVGLAFRTLLAQKLKSAFSIVGVFIGVMFLIAVVSVVQGMNRYMTEKFAGTVLGVNTFRLRQYPDVQLGNVTTQRGGAGCGGRGSSWGTGKPSRRR